MGFLRLLPTMSAQATDHPMIRPPDRSGARDFAGLLEWWRGAPSPRFRIALFGLMVVLLVTGLSRHAMWFDEIQAWLIARDSHGVVELVHNLRYEGHPALWYLLLLPFTALGRQPQWMQVAQAACAIGCVALIVWRSPFSRFELALLPFSYCLLFEYGVKSRSYALGNLLLLAFCALYPKRRTHPLLLACILALMANVHALFCILAVAGLISLLIDQANPSAGPPLPTRTNVLCCAVVLLGALAAAATTLPPPDSGFAVGWRSDLSLPHVVRTFEMLSGFTMDRPAAAERPIAGLVGVMLIGIGISRYRRLPATAFFFGAGTLGMTALYHLKALGFAWHHGLLFMVLVASVWIGRVSNPQGRTLDFLPRWLFAAVLVLQSAHGIASYAHDAVRPYSNGRAIAEYLARQGWTDAPTFALEDFSAASVLGYLGVEHFYYAQGARWGSFVVFDDRRLEPIDEPAFFALVQHAQPSPTILDCAADRSSARPAAYGFVAVATLAGSTRLEDCTIYRRPE